MGPLASVSQRADVLTSLHVLSALPAPPSPPRCRPFRRRERRHPPRCLCPPVLVVCEDPDEAAPHEVEVFGPVATVMPYATLDDAIALAARGRGSLAGSVVTHDPDVARHLVLGLAPFHGRVLVLDRDDAAESTGHGSPLPGLVHGGPGRARVTARSSAGYGASCTTCSEWRCKRRLTCSRR